MTSPLFSSSLLPAATLPAGYTIRPLEKGDYHKGYLATLTTLTHVGAVSEAEWNERFDDMAAARGTYFLLAIEFEGAVIGTGSLVVERKL